MESDPRWDAMASVLCRCASFDRCGCFCHLRGFVPCRVIGQTLLAMLPKSVTWAHRIPYFIWEDWRRENMLAQNRERKAVERAMAEAEEILRLRRYAQSAG